MSHRSSFRCRASRVATLLLPGAVAACPTSGLEAQFVEVRVNQDPTGKQWEPQLAVNPLEPNNLVAVWIDSRTSSQIDYGFSFDGGQTWGEGVLEESGYQEHFDPAITVDRLGNFYAVMMAYNELEANALLLAKSTDGGMSWGKPVPVISGTPGVTEDKGLVACDRVASSPQSGNLYVAWSRFSATAITDTIMCARSTDGGQSFSPPVIVSDAPRTFWAVPVVDRFGEIHVAWLNTLERLIKIDVSTDGGATFGVDRTVTSVSVASTHLNGNVWVFSFPAIDADIFPASGHVGNLYLLYMDRTGADFDILMRRSTDSGVTWSSPVRVNDDTLGNGRDQFLPWVSVDAGGTVHAAWLDRRNDPNNLRYDCYISESTDGGLSWEQNRRVSSVSSDPMVQQLGRMGEYIGLASAGGRAWPMWTDTRSGNHDVWAAYEPSSAAIADPSASAGRLVHLGLPRPNPFDASAPSPVTIPVHLAGGGGAELRVYDVGGRVVQRLWTVAGGSGDARVTWDGRDETGAPVASGAYYLEITGPGGRASRPLVVVR